jgi:hypothetical protein
MPCPRYFSNHSVSQKWCCLGLDVTCIVPLNRGGYFRVCPPEADVSIDGIWRGPTQGKPNAGIANLRLQSSGQQLKGEIVISDFHTGDMTAQVSGKLGDDNLIEAVLESFRITTSPAAIPRRGTLEGHYDPQTPLILGKWRTDTGAYGMLFLVPCPNLVPQELRKV